MAAGDCPVTAHPQPHSFQLLQGLSCRPTPCCAALWHDPGQGRPSPSDPLPGAKPGLGRVQWLHYLWGELKATTLKGTPPPCTVYCTVHSGTLQRVGTLAVQWARALHPGTAGGQEEYLPQGPRQPQSVSDPRPLRPDQDEELGIRGERTTPEDAPQVPVRLPFSARPPEAAASSQAGTSPSEHCRTSLSQRVKGATVHRGAVKGLPNNRNGLRVQDRRHC